MQNNHTIFILGPLFEMTVFWQVFTSDAVATRQDRTAFTGRPWQRPRVTVPSHISPRNPGLPKRAQQVEIGEGPWVLSGWGKDMIPCPRWLYRGPGQSLQQILTSWVQNAFSTWAGFAVRHGKWVFWQRTHWAAYCEQLVHKHRCLLCFPASRVQHHLHFRISPLHMLGRDTFPKLVLSVCQ